MKPFYTASYTDCIITSEDMYPPSIVKNKRFHCVRKNRNGVIVAILPLVGTDEEQRKRAEVIADALTNGEG